MCEKGFLRLKKREAPPFLRTCSTGCIELRLRISLVLLVRVILANRQQVRVHCPHAGHSSGIAAVPVVPLGHQPHDKILQLGQFGLKGAAETQEQKLSSAHVTLAGSFSHNNK